MARVTVEDCLDFVDNRFELVLVATKRARLIANGNEPMVDWENDKPTVVALREIADGLVDPKALDQPVQTEEDLEAEMAAGVEVTREDIEDVPGIEAQQPDTSASQIETPAQEGGAEIDLASAISKALAADSASSDQNSEGEESQGE